MSRLLGTPEPSACSGRCDAQEKALLADFRLVIDRAAAFSVGRPFEAAVVYGCREVGYIKDGEVEPGLTRFFADTDQLPVRDHE